MALPTYLTITGERQGLISAGASGEASLGNAWQPEHEDQIQVLEVHHDIRGAGDTAFSRREHDPLTIIKPMDKSSPLLQNAWATGENLPYCRLDFYRITATGQREKYYCIELEEARITTFNTSFPPTQDVANQHRGPTETVSISYRKITWTHVAGTTGSDRWRESLSRIAPGPRAMPFEPPRPAPAAEVAKPAVQDCVFAKSCLLPLGVVAHPATAVPAETLEAYGDWAVMAKSNVAIAEPAQWRMLAGTLGQSFRFGYQLDLARLSVLPGLAVGSIAMLIPRTIATDSAFYTREQYDLLHSVNTQVRLGFKELPDESVNAYGVYTGNNPGWRKMQPVIGVAEGENFVFDLGDGIKLTWTPIVDTNHVLGIPALEGVDNPGLTLVHPGEEVGPGRTYENPIHSPDIRDAILVFPVAGIAPLYVALSVRPGDHKYYPAPTGVLPAFPDAEKTRQKTRVQGGGALRYRWKDQEGNIYEWDRQHGKLEKYNKRGKHLGEFDHVTGEQTKLADTTRNIEP